MKIRHLLVVLTLLVAGTGAVWPVANPVIAQDAAVPAAALVEGTCDNVGDTAAELKELRIRDGGEVLSSFTTIDLDLADILGDAHAVVLTGGGDVIACGTVEGSGNDVYSGVTATSDAGWGGIVWFHERDTGTQVTLFVAQGLSAPSVPTAEPTEGPPVPPDDDDDVATPTPGARPTRTPRPNPTAGGDTLTTYTSPSFGYTQAYESTIWEKFNEVSQPADSGPIDILELGTNVSLATLVGETGAPDFDATDLCDARLRQYTTNPSVSGLTVIEPNSRGVNHAVVVFEYTFTADNGNTYDWRTWIDCFSAPDNSVLLSYVFSAVKESADDQVEIRQALLDGLTFPGEG